MNVFVSDGKIFEFLQSLFTKSAKKVHSASRDIGLVSYDVKLFLSNPAEGTVVHFLTVFET